MFDLVRMMYVQSLTPEVCSHVHLLKSQGKFVSTLTLLWCSHFCYSDGVGGADGSTAFLGFLICHNQTILGLKTQQMFTSAWLQAI